MPKITYGNQTFEYTIIRKNNKSITIKVNNEGKITITCPSFIKESEIYELVMKKADWIIGKLKLIEDKTSQAKEVEFISGEHLLYMGEKHMLEIHEIEDKKGYVRLSGEKIEAYVPSMLKNIEKKDYIRALLIHWYKYQAREKFVERTNLYGSKLKLYPKSIRVKGQKTLWGSCSSKENINFNWRLIMAPLAILDYVVVHELCHLKERNHSSRFWALVESIVPDYKEKRKWLKDNGMSLNI